LKSYRGGHKNQRRGREKEEEKKDVEIKPGFYFLHAPLLHEGDIEMNLMTLLNDIFSFQISCTHHLKTAERLMRVQHAPTLFLIPFYLLKYKTNPHVIPVS
jgi:hypothetical protein